jgi:hypothetical protein
LFGIGPRKNGEAERQANSPDKASSEDDLDVMIRQPAGMRAVEEEEEAEEDWQDFIFQPKQPTVPSAKPSLATEPKSGGIKGSSDDDDSHIPHKPPVHSAVTESKQARQTDEGSDRDQDAVMGRMKQMKGSKVEGEDSSDDFISQPKSGSDRPRVVKVAPIVEQRGAAADEEEDLGEDTLENVKKKLKVLGGINSEDDDDDELDGADDHNEATPEKLIKRARGLPGDSDGSFQGSKEASDDLMSD